MTRRALLLVVALVGCSDTGPRMEPPPDARVGDAAGGYAFGYHDVGPTATPEAGSDAGAEPEVAPPADSAAADADVGADVDVAPPDGSESCDGCPPDRPLCAGGACVCTMTSCSPGTSCEAGLCEACDVDTRCGSGCLNCVTIGRVCAQDGSGCIECDEASPCGAGYQCLSAECVACTTASACGLGCAPCAGETPACTGGQCTCTATSCGLGTACVNGACDPCDESTHCGLSCTDCTKTPTPVCQSGKCVCTGDGQCGSGAFCVLGICEPCGGEDPLHCGPACAVCSGTTPVCSQGQCLCSEGACPPGHWCGPGGSCQACGDAGHCGTKCLPCGGTTPWCVAGACVACTADAQCGPGAWCSAGACTPCAPDDPGHCGFGCAVCAGAAPICDGGGCVCGPGTCGVGAQCTGGQCEPCDDVSACGPSCAPCTGTTPYCAPSGCVACLDDGACPADQHCAAGACVPDCQVQGCASDLAPNGKKCSTAWVIGRKAALAGFSHSSDTTDMGNDDDLDTNKTACWDARDDVFYRVWMQAGESLTVAVTPTDWSFDVMLKLYVGTACDGDPATLIGCTNDGWDDEKEQTTYTATADGWITVVVDGRMAFYDDYDFGKYTLAATLSCQAAGCCCL